MNASERLPVATGLQRGGQFGSRRRLAALACALALVGAVLVLARAHRAGVGPHLFARDSVWNAALARDAPLDARSERLVSNLVAEVGREIRTGTGPWISTTSYSSPLYVVGKDQRRVPVALDAGSWGGGLRRALAEGVPIPDDARPAGGSDAHLTIVQPARDTLWEFWRASKRSDGWHAGWGGKLSNLSSNPGYYRNDWRDDHWVEQADWGASATSLPVIAGVPLLSELRRGRIGHALAIAIPAPCAGWFVWPAQRTDGSSRTADCLPEGARLRLDPNLDLRRLRMPPLTRILAVAAQRYGMIVRDKTGGAVGFYLEAPKQGHNPYDGPRGLFGGRAPWDLVRAQFPWAHLQVLKLSRCTRSPCARAG